MKKLFLAISIFTFLALNVFCQESELKLVWSDEFEISGLPDNTKWTYEEGFIRNKELQYYTKERSENVRVQNGHLIIESRKEKFPNAEFNTQSNLNDWQHFRKEAEYTSGSITTKDIIDWSYGRFEIKAQLPSGRGLWPAIWLLSSTISEVGWPACGEIDIMENVGYEPDSVHANVHTKKYNHMLKTNKGASIYVEDLSSEFHVYAIEWTKEKIDFFVDDSLYFSYKNDNKGTESWPFDNSHYLIINLAVGGSWGGQKGIDETIFPQKFLIDYVRVYQ